MLDGQNPPLPFRIFMNNVLDYGGYRFFQSSYHPDEKGSILSVNNDPGKTPTYIGYAMLILGVIWLLFDKNGRFATLGRFLKTQKFFSLMLCSALCYALSNPQIAYASTQSQTDFQPLSENEIPPLQDIPSMIKALADTSSLTNDFDRILVQDFGGRIKPMHTLANEYIHKLTQQRTFKGLNPSQVFLGMLFYPQEWQSIQMIATKSPKLRQILGLDENQKHIAYIDVFTPQGQYILQNYVEAANLKSPSLRDTFEKDVISVDERINYAFLIYTGQVLRIFPDNKSPNNQWLYPLQAISSAVAQDDTKKAKELMQIYKKFAQGMQQGINTHNWQEAAQATRDIRTFQQNNGGSLLISPAKVDSEIWLNLYNPFYQLTYPYIFISIVLFIIVLAGILKNLSGVVFYRRSNLALCASSFLAGMTLFVANLGDMDPQIGNLMPVLKSYWLNIHVSVITASYGFLGLCFMLGLITLIMFLLRNEKRSQVDCSILSLSALNEMSMILGLFLLSVGNFLGGIWANESWGRYWGWDSKETWALISIGVYAIILHLRFVVPKNFPFIFASASVIGFFSVLMTYFGVNYYLTGMHSYAAGEAEPVPLWVELMVAGIILLIIIASRKRVLDMPHL